MVPIQNIYYLLCYAWDKLEERDRVHINPDGITELQDLFAKILINGTRLLLKRGIERTYIETVEEYAGIKGKLLVELSVKRNLFAQKKTICCFDEFSSDILINQIILTTILKLINTKQLDKDLKKQLRSLVYMLPGIKRINLNARTFKQVRLNRNNKFYGFLMNVCEIIYENLLPTEEPGNFTFNDFTRDDRKMNQLFEAFVRNFYKLEQIKFSSVRVERIKWQLIPKDRESEKYIPRMMTDITLENNEQKIIIDAKYYRETLASYYDSEKIHSTNMYQLFSYLLNQEDLSNKSKQAKGILLYPTIKKSYDLSYQFREHTIEIKTVDLDMKWKEIAARLQSIIT